MDCQYCNIKCPVLNKEQCPVRALVDRVETMRQITDEVTRLTVSVEKLSKN